MRLQVTLRSRGNAGGGGGAAPAPVIQAHVDAADLAAVEAIDRIADVDTFNAKYDSLERAIAAAVMGTPGDAHLRARVLALSARLTAEAARAGAAGAGALSLQARRGRARARVRAIAYQSTALHAQGALERRDAAAAEAATAAISSAWLEQNGGEQHAKVLARASCWQPLGRTRESFSPSARADPGPPRVHLRGAADRVLKGRDRLAARRAGDSGARCRGRRPRGRARSRGRRGRCGGASIRVPHPPRRRGCGQHRAATRSWRGAVARRPWCAQGSWFAQEGRLIPLPPS